MIASQRLKRLERALGSDGNGGDCHCGFLVLRLAGADDAPPVPEKCPRCGGGNPPVMEIEEEVFPADEEELFRP